MTALFIAARAIHIGACLLFFAIFAFDSYQTSIVDEESSIALYWCSRLHWISLTLLPIIFISGTVWFACVAMTMSGEPLQFQILKTVWTRTQFGLVSTIRLLLWLPTLAIALLTFLKRRSSARKTFMAIQLILSGSLLGSLAWVGHGRESSSWHLLADILHLLAAGLWPAGLLPFLLLINKMRQTSEPASWTSIVRLVRRFSAMSLGCVALLAATGVVNSWFLVGSFSNLINLPYGRWLLAKIILFGIAVSVGAVNLLRLKPQLLNGGSEPASGAAVLQLRRNVLFEIFLGTAIVVIVAVLGILPP